jgi:hypothetical protein
MTATMSATGISEKTSQYLQLGLLLFGFYWLASYVAIWYPLRHFRGPRLASFSWLWTFTTTASGSAYRKCMALQDEYAERGDKVVRVGPDLLMTADPDIARRISGARSTYTKGEWYHIMRVDPYQHTMFSTTDTVLHDDLKAKTAAGYAGREVPTLERDVDTQIAALKRLLREKYLSTPGKTREVDLGRVVALFALDAITRIAFGQEFGGLAADADTHGYVKTIENVASTVSIAAEVPFLRRILFSDAMLRLVGPKTSDETGVGKMMG